MWQRDCWKTKSEQTREPVKGSKNELKPKGRRPDAKHIGRCHNIPAGCTEGAELEEQAEKLKAQKEGGWGRAKKTSCSTQ